VIDYLVFSYHIIFMLIIVMCSHFQRVSKWSGRSGRFGDLHFEEIERHSHGDWQSFFRERKRSPLRTRFELLRTPIVWTQFCELTAHIL
jgi:hypothetical protein